MNKKIDEDGFFGSLLKIAFAVAKMKEAFLILPILTVIEGVKELRDKKKTKKLKIVR